MNLEFKQALTQIHPNKQNENMIYIRNTITTKNIHVGEFTYCDSDYNPHFNFERDHVFYNVEGHGDLFIGKFCSIAYGVEFIMGAANHSTKSISTYPFSLISDNWHQRLGMSKEDMPKNKDTIIQNDVWLGRKVKIMPGITIGNGAIIGSYSVVTKDIPAYSIAVGSPAKVIKMRFDQTIVDFLEELHWWDFNPLYLEEAIPYLSTLDIATSLVELERIKKNAHHLITNSK